MTTLRSTMAVAFAALFVFAAAVVAIFHGINGDVQGDLSAARTAAMLPLHFPANVVQAYELKLLLDKLIFFFLYNGASLFAGFFDKPHFEIAVLALYSLGALAVALCVTATLSRRLNLASPDARMLGLLVAAAIFTVDIMTRLQPEMLSLLVTLVALALAVTGLGAGLVLGGVVAGALFYIKMITLADAGFIVLLLVWLDGWKSRRLAIFCAAAAVSLGVLTLIQALWFPLALRDVVDALQARPKVGYGAEGISKVMAVAKTLVSLFFRWLPTAMLHLPLLIPGLISSVLLWGIWLRQKLWRPALFLALAWGLSLLAPLSQMHFDTNHFVTLLYPACTALFLLLTGRGLPRTMAAIRPAAVAASIVLLVWTGLVFVEAAVEVLMPSKGLVETVIEPLSSILLVLILAAYLRAISGIAADGAASMRRKSLVFLPACAVVIWAGYVAPWSPSYRKNHAVQTWYAANLARLNTAFPIAAEPEILVVADHMNTYHLNPLPACRDYVALPYQYLHFDPTVRNTRWFREFSGCVNAYQGKYALISLEWIGMHGIEDFAATAPGFRRCYHVVDAQNPSFVLAERLASCGPVRYSAGKRPGLQTRTSSIQAKQG